MLGFTALLMTAAPVGATVTINLEAAVLFQSDGTTAIPMDSLIQLVASTTDSAVTLPSTTSFTGGSADDVILASFGSNNAGGPGSFLQPIIFSLTGNLNTGDELMLRWWPSLTVSSSTPGTGATFGQFRTDAVENGSNIAWVVPADGSTVDLNFKDLAFGGTEPNSAGTASFSTTAVPETSTVLCAGLCAVLLLAHAARRRLVAAKKT